MFYRVVERHFLGVVAMVGSLRIVLWQILSSLPVNEF